MARSGEESVCLKDSPGVRELGGWQVAPAVVAREGGSALGSAASGARRNPKCCLAGFLWVVWRALCKVKWQERGKTAAACRRQPWQIAAEEQHLPQSVAWRQRRRLRRCSCQVGRSGRRGETPRPSSCSDGWPFDSSRVLVGWWLTWLRLKLPWLLGGRFICLPAIPAPAHRGCGAARLVRSGGQETALLC